MTLTETVGLLAYLNRATNQHVAEGAEVVWHNLLGRLPVDDARAAADKALSESSRWIVPADILAAHHAIRRASHSTPPGSAPAGVIEPPRGVVIPFRKVPAAVEAAETAGVAVADARWRDVACPYCHAAPRSACTNSANGRSTNPHPSRVETASKENR